MMSRPKYRPKQDKRLADLHIESLATAIVDFLVPFGMRKIALFGSVARGESGPDSDVDILVEIKPAGQRPPLGLAWFSLGDRLAKHIGRRVDLVSAAGVSEWLMPSIERDLLVIYEEGR